MMLAGGKSGFFFVASSSFSNAPWKLRLLNKSAVERGKFNSIYFKTYGSDMNPHKSSTAEEERFGRPDPSRTQGIKHGEDSYKHLDDDGFAKLGSFVRTNDVLIGKTVKMKGFNVPKTLLCNQSNRSRWN